ncbi:MobA/MobL family protein [Jiella sp. M17.18]|uniref:MobA/MobL family protein n=1 Tax=Jiella sp. M17.18 TaxID=3234247 RepID=UPI0034E03D21
MIIERMNSLTHRWVMKAKGVHVSYSRVSRRTGYTALTRSRYQMGLGVGDRDKGVHLRQKILAPPDAPSWVFDPEKLWSAVASAERRRDALEAWFLDIQWPRELPLDLFEEVAEGIYGQFRDLGLVAQTDLEMTTAEGGGENPHVHGLISTRPLGSGGFATHKCRRLNTWFRLAGGFGPRFHVAKVLNDAATRYGIAVTFDGKSNSARDLPPGEDPVPKWALRNPEGAKARHLLDVRKRQRGLRQMYDEAAREMANSEAALAKRRAEQAAVVEQQPAFREKPGYRAAVERWRTCPLPAAVTFPGDAGTAYPAEGDDLVWDDGSAIRVDRVTFSATRLVCALARSKGWDHVDFMIVAKTSLYTSSTPATLLGLAPSSFYRTATLLVGILGRSDWSEVLLSWREGLRLDRSEALAAIVDELGALQSMGAPAPSQDEIVGILNDREPPNSWARYKLGVEAELSDVWALQAGRALQVVDRFDTGTDPDEDFQLSGLSTITSDEAAEADDDVQTSKMRV